jgi:hypothetical protein
LWLQSARLLRVIPCPAPYALTVETHFHRRRGCTVLLSPLDWLLVEIWHSAGIPGVAITRGIDAVFDARDRGRQFRPAHQVNSLAYCEREVLDAARMITVNNVGRHEDPRPKEIGDTLLIALPPRGKVIFGALQSQSQVDLTAEDFHVGMVFTVYPDEWHRHEALNRFGVGLEMCAQ